MKTGYRVIAFVVFALSCRLATFCDEPPKNPPRVKALAELFVARGTVTIIHRDGTKTPIPAKEDGAVDINRSHPLKGGDLVKTGPRSQATINISEGKSRSNVRLFSDATWEFTQDDATGGGAFRFVEGLQEFLGFGMPASKRFSLRKELAGHEGTEFYVSVTTNGTIRLAVLEGAVRFDSILVEGSPSPTPLVVTNGQFVSLTQGQQFALPIPLVPALKTNLVQWTWYYPGILALSDLKWPGESVPQRLNDSVAAYEIGNLPLAMALHPGFGQEPSNAERLYQAAIALNAGDVEQAGEDLKSLSHEDPEWRHHSKVAAALMQVIAAVQGKPWNRSNPPETLTEWLAESYYRQSRAGHSRNDLDNQWEQDAYRKTRSHLERALIAAKRATPDESAFGYGWLRRAELEFSFGRTDDAGSALSRSGLHTNHNAKAVSLRGLIASLQGDTESAGKLLKRAISLDGNFADAWFGLGLLAIHDDSLLSRIREGNWSSFFKPDFDAPGLRLLETAAAQEPQRSVLRSYLGKAYWENAGLLERTNFMTFEAEKQLKIAINLDRNDPTPYLYSALIKHQENRINEAIGDLEQSIRLNDNRQIYRSSLLLDQDRAVRSANLARIYQRAGMNEVSLQEASRAVNSDYANYSAHLFLAESFDALRDPARFNLRYETPWLNELLLAYALAPVGGGNFSRNVSQQEYSRLFEADRLGFSSLTEVRSDGQVRQLASQFGTYRNTSYSFDVDYQHNDGVRPNNELARLQWDTQIKHQFSPQDSVLLLASYQDYHSGDNFQYYNPTVASRSLRLDENEKPTVLAIYHREWQPGMHTLFLGGRLDGEQRLSIGDWPFLVLDKNDPGDVRSVIRYPDGTSPQADLSYRTRFHAYVSELNQIIQRDPHSVILGARFQTGNIETMDRWSGLERHGLSSLPVDSGQLDEDFQRGTLYGYYHWRALSNLVLITGLAYEHLSFPANFRDPPVNPGRTDKDRFLPKAGLVWSPRTNVTLRGAYAQSLGGVLFDQSYRLEPAQIAGFGQSFRSIIPESVTGSLAGADFESVGLAADAKLATRTYFGASIERLASEAEKATGVFDSFITRPDIVRSSTPEELSYEERSASAYINQLLGDEWAIGLGYRFTRSELERSRPLIPLALGSVSHENLAADLHQAKLQLLFNHPSGVFSTLQFNWSWQQNRGYAEPRPGDFVTQINLEIGRRFARQRFEIAAGVLNLTGEDYHLNPLNYYNELPRERVFFARLRVNL